MKVFCKSLLLVSPLILSTLGCAEGRQHTELRRYAVPEARQGVAVDAEYFIAITNTGIGKYQRDDGSLVAKWECPEGDPLIHLNHGMLFEGRLYTSHSNYPGVPSTGSIEIFDTDTLEHVDSVSFGHGYGSLTWIDRHDGAWYVCFAYYGNRAAEPSRDPSWTHIVKFDDEWRRTQSWVFPSGVIEKFGDFSCSGGAFGADGRIYVTGHDEQELFVMEIPDAGSVLKWVDSIPIPAEGQAFAWDPTDPWVLWSVLKKNREVIVGRIDPPVEGE